MRGRVTRVIDASVDDVEEAKQTAVSLIGDTSSKNTLDLFFSDNLEEIENGIRNLNEFSNKSWILSSILLYTLIYNNDLYRQSGLDWQTYSMQSRERLGIDNRDITEQLSAARFFILHHKALERAGFSVNSANRKLARAELALSLSNDLDAVINHLVKDTWLEFKEWYTTFKSKKKLPKQNDRRREDIRIDGKRFFVGDIEAVTVSDSLSESDGKRISDCIKKIFEIMRDGDEPAIVAAYDKKEAALIPKLRDKYRRGK